MTTSLALSAAILVNGMYHFVETKLINGWDNNNFFTRHLDEDSAFLTYLFEKYDGLYYQWDMGIQCKYEAGVWYSQDEVKFWTTLNTAKNIDFVRLYFKGKGQVTISSEEILKYWDGWPEDAFKKYATIPVYFDDAFEDGNVVYGVASYNGKLVPLDLWTSRYSYPD